MPLIHTARNEYILKTERQGVPRKVVVTRRRTLEQPEKGQTVLALPKKHRGKKQ